MSLKIWMVIYPSITLFLFLFGQQLSVLPLYQRTFILTVSLVPWMMFVGVPLLDLMIGQFSKGDQKANRYIVKRDSNFLQKAANKLL